MEIQGFLPLYELHRREDDIRKWTEKQLNFRVAAVKELYKRIGFDGLRKIAERNLKTNIKQVLHLQNSRPHTR